MNLNNISYRKYENSDFQKVFVLFLKFQKKVKIESYDNLTKGVSDHFAINYYFSEFKNLIKKSKYKYVGYTEEGKIFGFACFNDSPFIENGVDLLLVFKDEDLNYSRIMKSLLKFCFQKEFKNKRIFATLGPREKFDKYVNFVKRTMNAKVLKKDSFGKILVEFKK